jgi:outer membrane protein assembly factor BamB
MRPQYFFISAPVATSGMVYVFGGGYEATMFAFDGKTGNLRWSAGAHDAFAAPAVTNGLVYAAESKSNGCLNVFALDALTGANAWSFGGLPCDAGPAYSISVYNGELWARYSFLSNILSISNQSYRAFTADSMPSFHDGTAFYVNQGSLRAESIGARSTKWSFAGDGTLCTAAAIAGVGAQVFVGSSWALVYELDETSGKLKSQANAGDFIECSPRGQPMTIAGGRLFVSTKSALVSY